MKIVKKDHIGKVRTVHQDYVDVYINKNGRHLAILCDGMGGHLAGDVASKMAAVHFGNAWEKADVEDRALQSWIDNQLERENERILEKSNKFQDLKNMGTTLVGAAEMDEYWLVFNIGDSRAYSFSMNHIQQLTIDHSFVNELVKRGEITEKEARNHPQKNVLTQSLGVDSAVKADYFYVERKKTDLLLLCSDGLSNMVSEETIEKILGEKLTVEEKAEQLIQKALDAGGKDNISLVLIEEEKGGTIDGYWATN